MVIGFHCISFHLNPSELKCNEVIPGNVIIVLMRPKQNLKSVVFYFGFMSSGTFYLFLVLFEERNTRALAAIHLLAIESIMLVMLLYQLWIRAIYYWCLIYIVISSTIGQC